VDLNGGTNYVVLNTNQLLSVPYSLYSLNSGNSVPGPVGPQGLPGNQGVGIASITSSGNVITITLTNGNTSNFIIPNSNITSGSNPFTLIYLSNGF